MAFCNTVRELHTLIEYLRKWTDPQKPLNKETRESIAAHQVSDLVREISNLQPNMTESPHFRAFNLRSSLPSDEAMTAEILYRELRSINDELVMLAMRHKFVHIPSEYLEFFEQASAGSFEAEREMRDAGNCIALDLGTAAVFHCMRAAELGLREVAETFGVTVKNHGVEVPIVFGTWNDLIVGIRNRIEAARKQPSGHEKADKLQLYSGLADKAEDMKELWRNDICHTRKRYNQDEAAGTHDHVKRFLELVAKI